ncbi:MAG TPA: hypothetical protein ACFYEK_09395 [Candidatus Wunengus sp. YC60]|uniref:hypothetical protein n=1 Tax=Candidatus Wunengus sp. YC60 TaxID=3367697 RepID=UPI004027EF8D
MIQNLFRHKTFISIFTLLVLTLRPLRLCGKQLFYLFFVFIIPVLFSPLLFAEEHIEKKDIPVVTQANNEEGAWTGIDVSIVGKYATKYGHPPRDPYINTDKGDLLLFVFTFAGVVGGFVMGFNARKIFYEK